jgi:hypothetical protein
MISVPKAGLSGRVRRNTVVRVWGRANVAPTTTMLAYRIIGRKCSVRAVKVTDFCIVPGQRWGADRARFASMKLTMRGTYQFATYGGRGAAAIYGPARTVKVA